MTTFENRRQNYISLNKNNKSEYSIPLKIYNNENVSQKELDKLYNLYVEQKTSKKDTDFCLLLIIRILYIRYTLSHDYAYSTYTSKYCIHATR